MYLLAQVHIIDCLCRLKECSLLQCSGCLSVGCCVGERKGGSCVGERNNGSGVGEKIVVVAQVKEMWWLSR